MAISVENFENRKIFPPACILLPPLSGFPLELGMGAGGGVKVRSQRARMMGLQGRKRSLTISLAI